jgi:hypothetical protein
VGEQFTGRNLTLFGGSRLIRRFFERHQVQALLDQGVQIEGRRECRYSVGRMTVSLLYAMFLGLTRPTHMATLVADRVFQHLTGLHGFPVQSTISRFLSRLKMAAAEQLAQVNHKVVWRARNAFARFLRLTLDLDSHVTTVFGHQQRAAIGYNPKKRGRRSYHPLLCFIGETRDFLGGMLRSGDRHTGSQSVRFLRRMIELLPPRLQQVRLRADAGFFSLEMLRFATERKLQYYIVVPLLPWVQKTILQIRTWHALDRKTEVAESTLVMGKTETYRLVVIRHRLRPDQKPKKQLSLLNLEEVRYDYQAIVTGSREAPAEVWRFYNHRAACENYIKEAVYGFGLDKVVSHTYAGNAAFFQLLMMAYNLMNLFKESLGQIKVKETVQSLRRRLFLIPGKLTYSGRRYVLRLPHDWPHQAEFEAALAAAA